MPLSFASLDRVALVCHSEFCARNNAMRSELWMNLGFPIRERSTRMQLRDVLCRMFVFPESIAKGSSGKSLEHWHFDTYTYTLTLPHLHLNTDISTRALEHLRFHTYT